MIIHRTSVASEWVDYNGHLRDAYYLLIFSHATDALMDAMGLDAAGRAASGHSLFTLECHLNFLHEVKADAQLEVRVRFLALDAKRLHLHFGLHHQGQAELLAASEQLLLHVHLDGPRSAPFAPRMHDWLATRLAAQRDEPWPEHVGRVIGLPPSRR
ncbi:MULTISPECIES: thioesterase family protein [Pseudomonas]|uniref:thioesterase family protein n=1 Tax=Pseudomonas TaxID=286 RepID=UPI0002EE7510|nr:MULTISPECIES: thioesterase family protein [Pseudomonas]MDC7828771.1 thioesterase family protein [Pseudomonas benzopyrenica]WCE07536.1 thioesterase family protein [Pseudomonas sp. JBR1]SEP11657.1 acyl-CoA thioester hydrolase [Pseudomonas sp. Snoq117.2]